MALEAALTADFFANIEFGVYDAVDRDYVEVSSSDFTMRDQIAPFDFILTMQETRGGIEIDYDLIEVDGFDAEMVLGDVNPYGGH